MAVTTTTDITPAARTSRADGAEKTTTRGRRTRRETDEENNGCARYFLGKAENSDDTPAFEREVSSEGEALVEALRLGVTYYTLQEFRVVPDFAGRRPQLKKEPVHGK
jgi:hypothetical protein